MLTIGASHSIAAPRHFSSGTMSLRLVEYSRMRPQPVQVRLQVWSGSNCSTSANLGVRLILCLTMCPAILTVNARGNRIDILVGFGHDLVGFRLAWSGRLRQSGFGLDQPRQEEHQRG